MPIRLGRLPDIQSHKRQLKLKRLGIVAGFALLLILLAFDALIVRRQLGVQIANQELVAHTQRVLFGLERIESLLKDAETGQRGYLYTGDQKYLLPYKRAVGQIDPQIDDVELLTADNPRQQALIPFLRSQVQAKLSELEQTLALYRAGRTDEAKAMVQSDVGLIAMNNISQLNAQMEREETSLEASRVAAYQTSIQLTIVCIYLPSFLAAMGLIFLAYFILLEIDQREKNFHEIRRREEWFRVTLTSIGDAVIATNPGGIVTFVNPVAEKLTGLVMAQAVGKDIRDVFPIFNEDTRQPAENPVLRVIDAGSTVGLANHTVLQRIDGTRIPIEDSAAPIRDDEDRLVGVVMVFRDVTNERKTIEVLRQTEKLATAARLASSVAHEVNNPLAAVVNLVYLAKSAPDAPPSVIKPLLQAEEELERVAHITRQTLGFYRETNVLELIELPPLIETVLKLNSNKIKNKNIAVVRQFDGCPLVTCIRGELEQVISNLIANAADAVQFGGTIAVRAGCVDHPAGEFVHISVEDDGPGIADLDLDRIFEPFFTTKKEIGTGLGLWVAREILGRHGGNIQVNSRKDGSNGAVFRVLLPCSNELAARASEFMKSSIGVL